MFFKSLMPPGKCIGLFSQYSPRPQVVLIAGGVCPRQGRGTPEGLGTQGKSLGSVLLTGRRPRDQTQGPWPDLWPLQGLSSPVFRKARKDREGCRRGGVSQGARRAGAQACGRPREAARAALPPPRGHSPGSRAGELAHTQQVGLGVRGTLPPIAQDHSLLSSPAPTPRTVRIP